MRFLLLMIAVLVLFVGCSPIPDMPPLTPDAAQNNIETVVQEPVLPWEGETIVLSTGEVWLYGQVMFDFRAQEIYDIATGDRYSICSDPLCKHNTPGCLKRAMFATDDAVVASNKNTKSPMIYFETKHPPGDYRSKYEFGGTYMCRCDISTQTIQVIAGPYKSAGTWAYDVSSDTIYHTVSEVLEDGSTRMMLYSISGETGEWVAMAEVPGYGTVRCRDVNALFFSTLDGSVYRYDLKSPEQGLEKTEYRGTPYAGYVYYMEYDNGDKHTATIPEEMQSYPLRTENDRVYEDYSADLYRIQLDMPNAQPELVIENISKKFNVRCRDGYIIVAECDPVFQYALLQQDTGGSYKYYPYGDPAAPTNVKLYPRYSAHRTYHVIDVETMEERVISFAETTLSTPQISRNGGYIVSIISRDAELQLACMDELGMQYAAYGVVPFEFDTFSEISDEEVFVFTYTGNS